ncbi:hypothetical protein ACFE04_017909 [Oxalis oulophora]
MALEIIPCKTSNSAVNTYQQFSYTVFHKEFLLKDEKVLGLRCEDDHSVIIQLASEKHLLSLKWFGIQQQQQGFVLMHKLTQQPEMRLDLFRVEPIMRCILAIEMGQMQPQEFEEAAAVDQMCTDITTYEFVDAPVKDYMDNWVKERRIRKNGRRGDWFFYHKETGVKCRSLVEVRKYEWNSHLHEDRPRKRLKLPNPVEARFRVKEEDPALTEVQVHLMNERVID